jgi:phosphoribosylglycinamide formyltransferase 1
VKRLAVLASGTGSILEAIIATDLPLAFVLADRQCRALEIAATHNIPSALIHRADFGYRPRSAWDRPAFTNSVTRELEDMHIDLIAMAGFMTVFGPAIFEKFKNRILNTHPSLLPAFKGEGAVSQAFAARVPETGCTVHVATPELDSGRILAQSAVPILPGDTEAALHERIKTIERKLYPEAIRTYLLTV